MRFHDVLVQSSHPLLASRWARWCLFCTCFVLFGAWIAVLAVPRIPDAQYVVHYTTTFGIDALGSWESLLRLPITGSAFVILNMSIAMLLSPRPVQQELFRAPLAPHLSVASALLCVASCVVAMTVLLGSVLLWRMNT